MGKKRKATFKTADEKYAYTTKVVTSSTCLKCKNKCSRGEAYLEKMSKPGAVGRGVPCILTKGRAFK